MCVQRRQPARGGLVYYQCTVHTVTTPYRWPDGQDARLLSHVISHGGHRKFSTKPGVSSLSLYLPSLFLFSTSANASAPSVVYRLFRLAA
jgi:hypothetical protein